MSTHYKTLLRVLAASLITLVLGACGGGGGEGEGPRVPQSLVFADSGVTPALYLTQDDGRASAFPLTHAGDHAHINHFERSPDGRYVAYSADDGLSAPLRLFVARSDGLGVTLLSDGLTNADATVSEFHWSPDSRHLIFLADGQTTNKSELYIVPVDGTSAPSLISGSITPADYDIAFARWSPGGRYVSYLISDGTRHVGLNVHDTEAGGRDSTRVSQPASDALVPAYAGISDYAWSPDGMRIAYRADIKSDRQFEIFTVAPDGLGHGLANGDSGGTVYIGDFTWSPDSRYLAQIVSRLSDDGYVGLNTWDTRNAKSARVATATTLKDLAWSHDGTRLAFIDNHEDTSGPLRLYVHDTPSAGVSNVIHGGADDESVSELGWSPDDTVLAYITEGGLYVARGGFTGASVNVFAASGTQSLFGLVWSWGSDRLAFAGHDSATLGTDLYSVAASAGAAARLTQTSLDARVYRFYGPRWSWDDRRLVYGATRTTHAAPNAYIKGFAPDGSAETHLSETYIAGYFDY